MTNQTNEAVERYKLQIVNNNGDRYIRCEPAPNGAWVMFKDVEAQAARIAEMEAALSSIARNTCCDKCQEAALVARAALEGEWDGST